MTPGDPNVRPFLEDHPSSPFILQRGKLRPREETGWFVDLRKMCIEFQAQSLALEHEELLE